MAIEVEVNLAMEPEEAQDCVKDPLRLAPICDSSGLTEQFADLLQRAAQVVLQSHGTEDAEIAITLLGDEAIAQMNQRFLGHEGCTDVIAFPLYQSGEGVLGDIYIGFQQADRQAMEHGVDLAEELVRLAIHGVLHVLGHQHSSRESEDDAMWAAQEEFLRQVLP